MSEQIKPEAGIDVANVTFDADGKVEGISEETLGEISGGVGAEVDGNNNGCGNNISCSSDMVLE